MSQYLFLKFLHIIAFVYWLGGDLGTFLASRQVINRSLSPEARHVALKIMLACDMGPRLAMPLILPLGLHLAYLAGSLSLPVGALVAAWLAALYWFSVVLVLYLNEGKAFTTWLSKLDLYFRMLVVVLLTVYGGYALVSGAGAPWAAWKLIVFAALVACGIAIRIRLKPFAPAFADMMGNGSSAATDAVMENAIRNCRPWVWSIWGSGELPARY